MGRDKALLEIDGVALWRRQRDLLAKAGAAEIFLSARSDQAWVPTAEGFSAVVHDAIVDCGPLVGVTAALERASHPWVAVLAVDLPAMTDGWFSSILADCVPGVGIVGMCHGYFEPLAAIYPRDLRFLAGDAMVRGKFSLQHLLAGAISQGLMRTREISATEETLFENCNEPRT
jgi:molybdopterin-guanine dinucleotide biosynthesis protein A